MQQHKHKQTMYQEELGSRRNTFSKYEHKHSRNQLAIISDTRDSLRPVYTHFRRACKDVVELRETPSQIILRLDLVQTMQVHVIIVQDFNGNLSIKPPCQGSLQRAVCACLPSVHAPSL